MYKKIHTTKDVLNESLIYGSELTEKYEFPKIEPVNGDVPRSLKVVSFNDAVNELNPRKSICHFYVDDWKFERLWNSADRYIPILRNFKYVIGTDFSVYQDMPMALKYYNCYRDKALQYYMQLAGVNVIPNCSFSTEETFDMIMDGLPERSMLGMTVNGKESKENMDLLQYGLDEIEQRLKPIKIVCIGHIPEWIETGIPIIEFDSNLDVMRKRSGK